MPDSTPENNEEKSEDRPTARPPNRPTDQVWEEEIDLRELAYGVASWWWLWIGVPILVGLATGVYVYQKPNQYKVSASFQGDFSKKEVKKLGYNPFPKELLSGTLNESGTEFSNLKMKRQSGATETEYRISLNTTKPSVLQKELAKISLRSDSWVKTFKENHSERLESLREAIESKEKTINQLRNGLENWLNQVREIPGTQDLQDVGLGTFASHYRKVHMQRSNLEDTKNWVSETSSDFLGKLSHEKDSVESKKVGPQRVRNILLSFVVSFLLLLFGVTFWEIL